MPDVTGSPVHAPAGGLVATVRGRLVTISGDDHHVVVRGRGDAVRRVAFSPDGGLVAIASDDGTAQVWTVRGDHLLTLRGPGGPLRDVAFSPDGLRITTTADDGAVRVRDLRTGAEPAGA